MKNSEKKDAQLCFALSVFLIFSGIIHLVRGGTGNQTMFALAIILSFVVGVFFLFRGVAIVSKQEEPAKTKNEIMDNDNPYRETPVNVELSQQKRSENIDSPQQTINSLNTQENNNKSLKQFFWTRVVPFIGLVASLITILSFL